MNISLKRFELTRSHTINKLMNGDEFICYVIEPAIFNGALPYGKRSFSCLTDPMMKPCFGYTDSMELTGENYARQSIKILIEDIIKAAKPVSINITRSF
jgi:hypothetical protein